MNKLRIVMTDLTFLLVVALLDLERGKQMNVLVGVKECLF